MRQWLAIISGFIFVACCAVFMLSAITALVAKIKQNERLLKSALTMLLGSLVVGMVGFGLCSAAFELHIG